MFSLKKVLVPIDFSDRSAGAVRYAAALTARTGSELILAHVLRTDYVLGVPETGGAVFMENRAAQAWEHLESFLKDELKGVSVGRVLLEGDPASQIAEYASSHDVDLIMMATHGYGVMRHLLLGSLTAQVLHDASGPVWTAINADKLPAPEAMQIQHIVCAVDLGPKSAKVLCWAQQMANLFQARLSIVHVVPRPEAPNYFDAQLVTYMTCVAQTELEKLQEKVGTRAGIFVAAGEPAKVVPSTADRINADLLVIGRSSDGEAVGRLGTNAHGIIRRAVCPVVSI